MSGLVDAGENDKTPSVLHASVFRFVSDKFGTINSKFPFSTTVVVSQ
jgi:hypothetical protein